MLSHLESQIHRPLPCTVCERVTPTCWLWLKQRDLCTAPAHTPPLQHLLVPKLHVYHTVLAKTHLCSSHAVLSPEIPLPITATFWPLQLAAMIGSTSDWSHLRWRRWLPARNVQRRSMSD